MTRSAHDAGVTGSNSPPSDSVGTDDVTGARASARRGAFGQLAQTSNCSRRSCSSRRPGLTAAEIASASSSVSYCAESLQRAEVNMPSLVPRKRAASTGSRDRASSALSTSATRGAVAAGGEADGPSSHGATCSSNAACPRAARSWIHKGTRRTPSGSYIAWPSTPTNARQSNGPKGVDSGPPSRRACGAVKDPSRSGNAAAHAGAPAQPRKMRVTLSSSVRARSPTSRASGGRTPSRITLRIPSGRWRRTSSARRVPYEIPCRSTRA